MGGFAAPLITGGASILGGIFGRPRMSGVSPQEAGSFQQGIGTAGDLRRQGQNLFSSGEELTAGARQFITPLLMGSRSAMLEATAPERTSITDFFRGASRNIREGSRGGVRDLALATTARDKAATLSNLIPQLRGQAAGVAGQLGTALTGQGVSATGNAGSLFAQIAQALQQGRLTSDQIRLGADSGGGGIGRGIFEIVSGIGGRMGGGGGRLSSTNIGTGSPTGNIGLIPAPRQNVRFPLSEPPQRVQWI